MKIKGSFIDSMSASSRSIGVPMNRKPVGIDLN